MLHSHRFVRLYRFLPHDPGTRAADLDLLRNARSHRCQSFPSLVRCLGAVSQRRGVSRRNLPFGTRVDQQRTDGTPRPCWGSPAFRPSSRFSPQAFRRVLPATANVFIGLIKDSSLLSVIAVPELTYEIQSQVQVTFRPLELYTVLAITYFCITYPLSLTSTWLERRYQVT